MSEERYWEDQLSYLTLGYLTLDIAPLDTIIAAEAAGFNSVGIRITGRQTGDPYTEVIGNHGAIREMRRRLDGGGLRLANISAYHMYPDTKLSDLLPIVETTSALGSKIIVVNGHDPDQNRFTDTLSGYAEAAAKAGIDIALEFMIYSGVKTLQQAREIIKAAGRPNIKLLLDPLHLDRSGGTPADIQLEKTPISFAQLCDARATRPVDTAGFRTEARTERLYPGQGELPLEAYLAALPPGTEIEIEVPSPKNLGLTDQERAAKALSSARDYLLKQNYLLR